MDSTSGKTTTTTAASSSQINTVEEATKQFKQFDVVTDHSDHFYANSKQQPNKNDDCFTGAGGNAVRKKIMQEWKILEENLPDSIFVRVYEGRIDLLRFVIVGARGTPYHDGLFFFDLAFPSNYPRAPPKVYYQSHGLRLNPNLYHNGYVCLSLLNTWIGNQEEIWNPSSSTILQVLVSIQGLVLNEEPYYNEPERKPAPNLAAAYNEQVFLLSCKTMHFVIQNPPKNFEDFVACHFCECANGILRACKAYKNGDVKVGYYCYDKTSSPSARIKVSREFQEELDKHYLLLSAAFKKIGTFLEKPRPQPQLVIEEKKKEETGKKKEPQAVIEEEKKEKIGKRNEHGIGYKIIIFSIVIIGCSIISKLFFVFFCWCLLASC